MIGSENTFNNHLQDNTFFLIKVFYQRSNLLTSRKLLQKAESKYILDLGNDILLLLMSLMYPKISKFTNTLPMLLTLFI